MSRCSCGLESHMNQITDFPVGARIFFKQGPPGMVVDHCEDGRAMIAYPNGDVHTFHRIESHIERVELPGPTVEALQAEIERLKADIKATQDLILFLPLPDEPDRYRALTQLRAECYRMAKLIRT